MSITILPYIDQTLLQQQKDAIANSKKQEVLNQFEAALNAAASALETIQADQKAFSAAASPVSSVTVSSEPYNISSQTTPVTSASLNCPAELESYFKEASEAYSVDERLLKSIAKAESSFQSDATSHSGAMGIMQLMPATASSLGVSNAYDARENILGGAKYISQLLQQYQGDTSLALAAYNSAIYRDPELCIQGSQLLQQRRIIILTLKEDLQDLSMRTHRMCTLLHLRHLPYRPFLLPKLSY